MDGAGRAGMGGLGGWVGVVSGGRTGFGGGGGRTVPPYQSHAAGASHTAGEIAFILRLPSQQSAPVMR